MQINGLELNVQQSGSGQPLVLLHGLSSDITAMQPQIDAFSEQFHVIALDSRGHGRSDRPAEYTLQDHISDVIGVMDALDLPTVFLMGSSMGSYVAQGVATRQPQRVSKLVLVTPKASGQTSSSARLLAQHAAELEGRSPEEVQAFLADKLFAPTTSTEIKAMMAESMQQHAQAGLTLTPAQYLAANRALEGFDFRDVLPQVTAKTLILSGRFDPLNSVQDGEEIARLIPDARLEVLEYSGHLPNIEEPERLHQLVLDFLRE
ncbi:alpha/beta hydrolase (plasmid) [Deinococcus sp. KNUC1210]|uniref:alpha/beta fold hydrolase n=1 Tax=Deinococcus sp. KNUC1210 TaxID=2917691 RepID=UPI001EF05910|nr:alpha/beta hydrolase [Deinococcus sp. KNUC1210]ULH14221.1 alpha/beta hydrolase [Deinococcus sp. KNUC1210]